MKIIQKVNYMLYIQLINYRTWCFSYTSKDLLNSLAKATVDLTSPMPAELIAVMLTLYGTPASIEISTELHADPLNVVFL